MVAHPMYKQQYQVHSTFTIFHSTIQHLDSETKSSWQQQLVVCIYIWYARMFIDVFDLALPNYIAGSWSRCDKAEV